MRHYGRKAHLGRCGGLVIKVRDEYVHDCATECPSGHVMWPNVHLSATEIAVLVPVSDDMGPEEIDAAVAKAQGVSTLFGPRGVQYETDDGRSVFVPFDFGAARD